SDYEFMKEQLLDRYDITYALLTGSGHHVTGLPDPDYAAALCRAYNEHALNYWVPKDKRFKTVIWAVLQDPQQAAEEIERIGDHPDVVAVKFSTTTRIPFDQRYYYPIYEAAQRKNLPITIHPGGVQGCFATASPTA